MLSSFESQLRKIFNRAGIDLNPSLKRSLATAAAAQHRKAAQQRAPPRQIAGASKSNGSSFNF